MSTKPLEGSIEDGGSTGLSLLKMIFEASAIGCDSGSSDIERHDGVLPWLPKLVSEADGCSLLQWALETSCSSLGRSHSADFGDSFFESRLLASVGTSSLTSDQELEF